MARLMTPRLIIIACVAIIVASCKRSEPTTVKPDSDPVALEVGSRKIRLSELQAEINLLRERRSPAAANLEAFLEPGIDRLVAREQARNLGLDQDVALRRQYENLLIGRLRESQIEAKLSEITVTDEEIKAHFERNLASYSRPAQCRLALLFLPVSKHTDAEARAATRARLEEARTLALELPAEPRGFGSLAMADSEEASSRFKGGDVGWLEAGASAYRWPDPVVKAGFALANIGDISAVIEADDGYYIVKKLDARDAVVRSLDGRLRSSLEAAILQEKRTAIESSLTTEWKTSNPVTLHDDVLKSLQFQALPAPGPAVDAIPANP